MKTTVNININKQAFTIDEDAYQKLSIYISNIKLRFTNELEANEVIEDIEARIAELFSKQTNSLRPVVDSKMVDDVIQKLGRPEDIFMEDEAEAKSHSSSFNTSGKRVKRKLFRNPDDAKIRGLISGIALYFGIEDATIARIGTIAVIVLLALISKGSIIPFSVIIYIILSMVIPMAKTASEKLQMRGEDVNLNTIKNNVVSDLNRVTSNNSAFSSKINDDSFMNFFKIIGKVIVGLFVIKALFVLIGIIAFLLFSLVASNTEMANLFTTGRTDLYIASFGIFALVIAPTIAIIYFGLRWILGNKIRRPGVSWVLLALLFVGISLVGYETIIQSKEWLTNKKVYNELNVSSVTSDTINISASTNKNINNAETNLSFGKVDINGLSKIGDDIYMRNAELDIQKGDHLSLSKQLISQGSSDENALAKIRNINYNFSSSSNSITFDDFFSFPYKDKFRAQKVKLLLEVPVGKVIFLDRNTKDFIYDIDNVTNTYDKKMVGHYWLMTDQGLKCIDKEFKDENDNEDGDDADKKALKKAVDSLSSDLDNAKNVKININKEGLIVNIDKEDGSDSKITIKGAKDDGANIKIEKNGVEEKVIHINKDQK